MISIKKSEAEQLLKLISRGAREYNYFVKRHLNSKMESSYSCEAARAYAYIDGVMNAAGAFNIKTILDWDETGRYIATIRVNGFKETLWH